MTLIRRPLERHPIPMRSAIERLLSDWPSAFTDGGFGEVAPALDVSDGVMPLSWNRSCQASIPTTSRW